MASAGSRDLDGSGGRIAFGDITISDGAATFTQACWVRLDNTSGTQTFAGDYDIAERAWWGHLNPSSLISYGIADGNGTGRRSLNSATSASTLLGPSVWNYVTGTQSYAGTGDDLITVNSTAVTSSAGSDSLTEVTCQAGASRPLTIGDLPALSGYELGGQLAHLTMWKSVRTLAQIQETQHNPWSQPADWHIPLTESGSTYIDISGNGNNGTNDTTTISTSGPPVHMFPGGL